MGDYFNINNDISKEIKDAKYQGNLSKEDIDAFEKDESLFGNLIMEGENFTLAQKDENGQYKDVSLSEFNSFINNVAKQYNINLNEVSDDSNIMFKFLDKDGNGYLNDTELSKMKNFDGRSSKSNKIDGYTIGHYFSKLDKEELKELQKSDDTLAALKAYYETAKANGEEAEAIDALKAAGFDSNAIAEITGAKDVAKDLDSALNNSIVKSSIDGWIASGKDADYIIGQLNGMYGTQGLYDSANDSLVREYVEQQIQIKKATEPEAAEEATVAEEATAPEDIPEPEEEPKAESVSEDEIQAYADFFDSRIEAGKLDPKDVNAEYVKNKIKDDFPDLNDEALTELAEQIYDKIPKG